MHKYDNAKLSEHTQFKYDKALFLVMRHYNIDISFAKLNSTYNIHMFYRVPSNPNNYLAEILDFSITEHQERYKYLIPFYELQNLLRHNVLDRSSLGHLLTEINKVIICIRKIWKIPGGESLR